MEASCIFDVNVGMLNHHEPSQIRFVTVNKAGIVRLTVQHDINVRVSFMYYPGDFLRKTSADVLFIEEGPIYI
jgi:hypothetical protein